jgi:hypothetical protein
VAAPIVIDRSRSLASMPTAGISTGWWCACGNTNNNPFGMMLVHEDPTADPEDRMRLTGNSSIGGVNLAIWLVYRGAIQRWVEFLSV